MSDVLVVGAGAWGTALALQAARAGGRVTLWARDPLRAAAIAATRENPRLPGFRLPESVLVTHELPPAQLCVLAAPMQHLREAAKRCEAAAFAVCAKGLEAGTLRLPLEVLAEVRPGAPACVLTGPNLAREIAAGLPAAAVAAGADAALRSRVAAAFATARFRVYGNDDAIGAQIGGAAKNVIAIAAGAVIGAGLGENARAGLLTRGLAEIARLAEALGGRRETVAGLSGLGDLTLTCTSAASRNFSLGLSLGRGAGLEQALAESGGVTEGVAAAPALIARAPDVDLPICQAVADLLAGLVSVAEAVDAAMARPSRDE